MKKLYVAIEDGKLMMPAKILTENWEEVAGEGNYAPDGVWNIAEDQDLIDLHKALGEFVEYVKAERKELGNAELVQA